MKRKFLVFLSALFAIAAIGLIVMQAVQNARSSSMSKSLFNISVSNAMDNVIDQLNRLKVEDYISQNDRYRLLKYKRIEEINNRLESIIEDNQVLFADSSRAIVMGRLRQDSVRIVSGADLSTSDSDALARYNMLLGSRNKLTNGSAFYDKFVSELSEYLVDNLMSTASFNYKMLDSLIGEELLDNGVDLRPKVGVLHASDNQFLYMGEGADEEKLRESPFRYSFRPDGIMDANDYYILLSFPRFAGFLGNDTNIYFIMSIILICIIIVLYLMSVKTIYNERKFNEMKTDFINNMTHEIKTPIASIGLATEMLQDTSLSSDEETRNQFIGIIRDENCRMRVLVETILQSAKMANKNFALARKEMDIHKSIESVLRSFSLAISSRNGLLETRLEARNPILFADELHITNMIYNLVDNAIKYSPSKLHITISTQDDGECLLLMVSDEGMGISSEAQTHIFDKFYRVPNGDVHNVKGFGIGLNYVGQVVALHHGKVTVKSELDKGTTFEIRIPRLL